MSDDSNAHKTKMQEIQTRQRKRVADLQDPEKGLVLVHTGAGKGKSSSAFGVMVRALGWKQKVGVIQFIKGKWITGERQFFERLGGVTWHTMGEGFTWDTQDKDRDIAAAHAAFAKGREMMESGDYDLIVMDEINIALRYDYLSVEDVIAGLEARDKRTGVILTGRDAKPELCEYADLVTEMTEVKHPFKNGIKAQRGVDF
ncbi:cob(I)yrinic acid a,c-diamide adenosyltransferase [Sulfitobacter sp. F26169L]|uniref:cob(I)yrinic acid a,c-diamide adenosyltransferase n=1 Tax=Sulfitobacter sp. F26169L TaxID=2996015 RepID=UPI002260ABB3|nr:cob(I)yrinic acid a,c-diamide adenosyltransferase [Sulfitobacter sp. F26169L]MCX7566026.1 cob(I)yrinic acid a,c-diamide adenosyltransferase [Sulfitobacter sp. F26169L]